MLGEHARLPDPIGTPSRETLVGSGWSLDAVGGAPTVAPEAGAIPRSGLTHYSPMILPQSGSRSGSRKASFRASSTVTISIAIWNQSHASVRLPDWQA